MTRQVVVTSIDPKSKKCYADTPENRAAGLVTVTEREVRKGKLVEKDGVRVLTFGK